MTSQKQAGELTREEIADIKRRALTAKWFLPPDRAQCVALCNIALARAHIGISACDKACYEWPDDTAEHRAARAAYIRGAQDYGVPLQEVFIEGHFTDMANAGHPAVPLQEEREALLATGLNLDDELTWAKSNPAPHAEAPSSPTPSRTFNVPAAPSPAPGEDELLNKVADAIAEHWHDQIGFEHKAYIGHAEGALKFILPRLRALRDANAALTEDRDGSTNAALTKQLEATRSHWAGAERVVAHKDAEIASLRSTIASMETEKNALIKAVAAHVTVRGEYFSKIASMEKENEELRAQLRSVCGNG